jgi:hypothetical protein
VAEPLHEQAAGRAAYDQTAGRAALLLGLTAVVVAGLGARMFLAWQGRLTIGWPVPSMRPGSLIVPVVVGLLFQYAIPILAVGALLLGLPARGTWTGRIGILSASAALLIYAAFVLTCYQTIMDPERALS